MTARILVLCALMLMGAMVFGQETVPTSRSIRCPTF